MILPKPIKNFIGREEDIKIITDFLNPKNRHWIISLQGIGGIGKTELAILVANKVKKKRIFEKIVWMTAKNSWLELDGIRSKKNSLIIDDLLNNIIIDLNLPNDLLKKTIKYKWEGVVEFLTTEKALIIIDNLETITDDRIFQFLNEFPPGPSKVIVTTRIDGVLDNFGQRRLESKKTYRVGPLSNEEAHELFVKELEIDDFSRNNNKLIKSALTQIGNIPLAIYWVVGKVKLGNLSLNDAVNELSNIKGDVLKFCFENLISSVNNVSLKLLQAFAVFTSEISREGLCFVTGIDSIRFNKAIDILISSSLVEYKVTISGNHSYIVLPPTRVYINLMWNKNIELKEEYFLKATNYYLNFLEREVKEKNWSKISLEHSNIFYIFSWCFENAKHRLVIELAKYMILYLNRIGVWDERLKIADLSTKSANNLGDKSATIKFSFDEAILHKQRGKYEHAIELFEKTKRVCSDVNDKKHEIFCLMQIGIIQGLLKNYDNSNALLTEAEIQFIKLKEIVQSAICIHLIGRNEIRRGNFQKALEYFNKSMKIKAEENASRNIAIGLYDIANCYYLMGKYELSEKTFIKSMDLLKGIGDKRHLSNLHWYFANLKYSNLEYDDTILLLNKVIDTETDLQRERHLNRAQELLSLVINDRQVKIKNEEKLKDIEIEKKNRHSTPEKINKIIKKIKQNKLAESFELISNLEFISKNTSTLNEIIILESQYNLNEKQRNLDIINHNDYLNTINRLKVSILNILNKN